MHYVLAIPSHLPACGYEGGHPDGGVMKSHNWTGLHPAERGASATEYALLVTGAAVVLVGIIVFFGDSLAANLESFTAIF